MKTAVSLPDELFRKAEIAAKKLNISRSQFYAQALTSFLGQNSSESITEQLNQVYSDVQAEVDSALRKTQIDLLRQVRW
jgi:metal-responsive CopG/Arc/MetJ family transcriptional regulator